MPPPPHHGTFPSSAVTENLPCHAGDLNWSLGFPGGSAIKNPPANAGTTGDVGSAPGLGRSPGGGNGNPLQYSCHNNPMERRAWCATVHGVTRVRQDWRTERRELRPRMLWVPPLWSLCPEVRIPCKTWCSRLNEYFLKMPLHTLLNPPLFRGGIFEPSAWIWTLGLLPNRTWIKWCYASVWVWAWRNCNLLSSRPLAHRTQPPRCEEAQATRSGHLWILGLLTSVDLSPSWGPSQGLPSTNRRHQWPQVEWLMTSTAWETPRKTCSVHALEGGELIKEFWLS